MKFSINIDSIIRIGGIVASIMTVVLLFANENFVAGAVVIFVMILLAYFKYKDATSIPVTYKSSSFTIDLVDPDGHRANIVKESVLVVNEKNITQLTDRLFQHEGKQEFINTNIGEMLGPIQDGGTETIVTMFNAPLEIGKEYNHKINYIAWDSYTNKSENFSLHQLRETSDVEILVKFPPERLPIEIKAYNIYKNSTKEIKEQLIITDDRRQIIFRSPNVKVGTTISLNWTW